MTLTYLRNVCDHLSWPFAHKELTEGRVDCKAQHFLLINKGRVNSVIHSSGVCLLEMIDTFLQDVKSGGDLCNQIVQARNTTLGFYIL